MGRIGRAFLSVALAATIVGTYKAYEMWTVYQGQEIIDGIRLMQEAPKPDQFLPSLLAGKELFKRGTEDSLKNAAREFGRALVIKPQDPETISQLAAAWIEIGYLQGDNADLGRAATLIRYGKAHAPNSADLRKAQGRLEWRRQRLVQATRLFQSVVKEKPLDAEAQALLAAILLETGDLPGSALALDQALELDPQNSDHGLAFVKLLEKQKRFREAAAYLRKSRYLELTDNARTVWMLRLYEKAGDPDAAEEMFKQLIAQGDQVEVHRAAYIEHLFNQEKWDSVINQALVYLAQYPSGKHIESVRSSYEAALGTVEEDKMSEKRDTARKARRRGRSRRSARR